MGPGLGQPFFSFLSPPRELGHRHLREHLGTANAPSQPLFSFLSSKAPPPPSLLTSWAPQVAADLGASSLAAQVAADLGRRVRDLATSRRRWTTSSDKWAQPRATWPRPRRRLQGAARRRRVSLADGICLAAGTAWPTESEAGICWAAGTAAHRRCRCRRGDPCAGVQWPRRSLALPRPRWNLALSLLIVCSTNCRKRW